MPQHAKSSVEALELTTPEEAPALIQYACERCKTRFVLPPSSRKLNLVGQIRALSMGFGRTLRLREGLGTSLGAARRQLLAKMDDEAYQSFVQSFRFCHECRQFVCNECWSTSRRSCLTCVAKSMTGTVRPRPPFAPTGPEIPRPVVTPVTPVRKGRLRRDLAIVTMALAIVLVSIEAGVLLVNATSGAAPSMTPQTIIVYQTPSPSPSPTASPTPVPTPTATPTASPTASPSPTASASASASPTAKATPTRTPVPVTPAPTPAPTPVRTPPPPTPTPVPTLPTPTITCTTGYYDGSTSYTLDCGITNQTSFLSTDSVHWYLGDSAQSLSDTTDGSPSTHLTANIPGGTATVQVFVIRSGYPTASSAPGSIGPSSTMSW
jgi:hypothetical protein